MNEKSSRSHTIFRVVSIYIINNLQSDLDPSNSNDMNVYKLHIIGSKIDLCIKFTQIL